MKNLKKIEADIKLISDYSKHFMAYLTLNPSEVKFFPSGGNHKDMIEKSVYALINKYPIGSLNNEEREFMEEIRNTYGVPNLESQLYRLNIKMSTHDKLKNMFKEVNGEKYQTTLGAIVKLTSRDIEMDKDLGPEILEEVTKSLRNIGYELTWNIGR